MLESFQFLRDVAFDQISSNFPTANRSPLQARPLPQLSNSVIIICLAPLTVILSGARTSRSRQFASVYSVQSYDETNTSGKDEA